MPTGKNHIKTEADALTEIVSWSKHRPIWQRNAQYMSSEVF